MCQLTIFAYVKKGLGLFSYVIKLESQQVGKTSKYIFLLFEKHQNIHKEHNSHGITRFAGDFNNINIAFLFYIHWAFWEREHFIVFLMVYIFKRV